MRILDKKRALVKVGGVVFYRRLFVGMLCRRGLRYRAEAFVTSFFYRLQLLVRRDVVLFFRFVLRKCRPLLGFALRKVGSRIYKLPVAMSRSAGHATVIRWFVQCSFSRTEFGVVNKLYNEFVDLCSGIGRTWRKIREYYRIAEANKPFLRYLRRRRAGRRRFRIRRLR